MTNNEVKNTVNKLNARLKKLKTVSPTSYEFAIAQLEQIPGVKITNKGNMSIDKGFLYTDYIDKILGSAENSVPTLTAEMKYIEKELDTIDKKRARLYGQDKPKRDKSTLLVELNAKRYYDLRFMQNGSRQFDEIYEAWETHTVPFFMTEELINLENEIERRLGKGIKGIKTYAELYAIQQLIEEYFEEQLVAASKLAENDLR